MILNRDRVYEENQDLTQAQLKMLKDLSDVDLCKFMIWNHANNMLFNLTHNMNVYFSTCIIGLQIISIICCTIFKINGIINSRTQFIFTALVTAFSVSLIVFSIIMDIVRDKSTKELRDINNYIELYHRTILEDEITNKPKED